MTDEEIERLVDEFFSADDVGQHERAAQALDALLQRHPSPPPLVHNVPKWLAGWLPSVFWHTKDGSE